MKILVLNASVTGTTKALFDRAKQDYAVKFGPAEFTELDLNEMTESLSNKNIGTSFYAEGTKYIDMIQSFDEIILITGMQNYGIPAIVKNFIDKITLPQITFAYNANGVYSPMQGKWKPKFIVFASSGTAKEYYKHDAPNNWLDSILNALEFNGFEKEQLSYVWADGTNMPNVMAMSFDEKYEFFKERLMNPVQVK